MRVHWNAVAVRNDRRPLPPKSVRCSPLSLKLAKQERDTPRCTLTVWEKGWQGELSVPPARNYLWRLPKDAQNRRRHLSFCSKMLSENAFIFQADTLSAWWAALCHKNSPTDCTGGIAENSHYSHRVTGLYGLNYIPTARACFPQPKCIQVPSPISQEPTVLLKVKLGGPLLSEWSMHDLLHRRAQKFSTALQTAAENRQLQALASDVSMPQYFFQGWVLGVVVESVLFSMIA